MARRRPVAPGLVPPGTRSPVETVWGDVRKEVDELRLDMRSRSVGTTETVKACRELTDKLIKEYQSRALVAGTRRLAKDEVELLRKKVDAVFGANQLQPYLDRDDVENIHCFSPDRVVLSLTNGRKEYVKDKVFADDEDMRNYIAHLATTQGNTGRRFDMSAPMLDLRLKSGERIFAAMSVCHRPYLTVRCHRLTTVTLDSLMERGTISEQAVEFLSRAVRPPEPMNILVAGSLGCGKTTLLRALLAEVDTDEYVCTLEQTFELFLEKSHPNTFAAETRDPNSDGQGEIGIEELSKRSLRSSVDRVIVGELRGPEALTFLSACGTGADGSMATIHASNAAQAVSRLVRYCTRDESAGTISQESLEQEAADVLHLVIHLRQVRKTGLRYVHTISEVLPGLDKRPVIRNLFVRKPPEQPLKYVAAPQNPEIVTRLAEKNMDMGNWKIAS